MSLHRTTTMYSRRLASANQFNLINHAISSPKALALYQIRSTTSNSTQQRTKASQIKAQEILAAQRRLRPVSPHLGIYRPQITWVASVANRITGLILSGGFYIFGLSYLTAPYFGWNLDSIVSVVASWPFFVAAGLKTAAAFPFAFHSFNGMRHLIWDNASMLTNRKVVVSGWVAVGLSVVSALYLGFVV